MFSNKTKTLRLSRETVRTLTGAEMAAVAGGALKVAVTVQCNGIIVVGTGEKTTSVKCVRAR